jgi:hypothetical protein
MDYNAEWKNNQKKIYTRQAMYYDVTLKRVRAATVTVKNQ